MPTSIGPNFTTFIVLRITTLLPVANRQKMLRDTLKTKSTLCGSLDRKPLNLEITKMKSDIITIRIGGTWNNIEFQIPATALPLFRQSLQLVSQSSIDGEYRYHIVDDSNVSVLVLEGLTTLRKIEEVSND